MSDIQPTKEQVQAANEAEEARWQGDFNSEDLKIPYKQEASDDESDKRSGSTDDGGDGGANDKLSGDTGATDEQYADPAPVVTVQDPGEYQPADYSFEVTLKDGKKFTVSTPEDADKVADDPDNFETAQQLSHFLKKQMSMERKLERDREKYDAQKQTFDQQTAIEAERIETVNNFQAEFEYLVSKGLLPPIAPQYMVEGANWNNPEIAEQPGVKEQLAILDYMVKENTLRSKAKVKPITSIVDAFNAWKLETNQQEVSNDNRAAGEARRAAGARVAGSSPTQQGSYAPKGIAVGDPNVFRRQQSVWDN